jgi:tetratricopeptide (TPR) repeat protein
MTEGIHDPDRPKIYNRMLASVFELTDLTYQHLLTHRSGMQIYQIKKDIENKLDWMIDQAADSISGLRFETDLDELLGEINLDQADPLKEQQERHKMLARVFELVWLTDRFNEKEINLIQSIRKSGQIMWFEKCVIVSALTLSLILCFDQNKLDLLITFYEDDVDQIWQRALVGLLFALYLYDDRLKLYPGLTSRLSFLKEREGLAGEIQMVLIQIMRSKETERITKKLQEEILPEVAKLAPRLEDKLDLENLISKDPMDEKNPDWEDFFKDTPDLYNKMEEFTNLQMEGSDVFWSAFAMLKHFDFFHHVHNWFLPFHRDNLSILDLFRQEFGDRDPETLLDGIARSAFLCNSDKYSFCLNTRYLQEGQKSLLLNFFTEELKNINEITEEDSLLNKSTKDKFIFTQYIQDLYRFHKLHPFKGEMTDIFNIPLDLHQTWFLPLLVEEHSIIRNIAEFYFERDQFDQAREIYQMLNKKGDNSYEIFEKIGYCYQRARLYEEALDYYLKAELYDTNRLWLAKKIALCYRNLKKYDEAIQYYTEVLKMTPESTSALASIGHCYLDRNELEKALNYFYKVEFLSPEDVSALRPIAWISFIRGDFKEASSLYGRIINKDPNKYDYMNLGHVEWCLGNRMAALSNYKLSIRQKDNNLEQFLAGFSADQVYLVKHGIAARDIPLMLDYLKYTLDSSG